MKSRYLAFSLFISIPAIASGPSIIECEPLNPSDAGIAGIWPQPYLSKDKLCFNLSVASGSSCVGNGKTTKWLTEAIIIDIDGESQGRDDTWFRVVKPTINDQDIEYTVEASRDKKNWVPLSHVSINRISGVAVNWFIYDHGGISYQCRTESKKI